MRQLGESIEELLDIEFGSTGDDNLEPRGLCGCIGQNLQDALATPIVATLVKCVNDKDESTFGGATEFADEVEEYSVLHRLWRQVWVVTKALCHNASKMGEDHGEFVDESRKDISRFL